MTCLSCCCSFLVCEVAGQCCREASLLISLNRHRKERLEHLRCRWAAVGPQSCECLGLLRCRLCVRQPLQHPQVPLPQLWV